MKPLVQGALAAGLLASASVLFLVYSYSASFSNWPFTRSFEHTRGVYRGITIGATKAQVFDELAGAQRSGKLEWTSIYEPGFRTYAETFGTQQLGAADRPRVTRSDRWHANVPGCNCWAVLEFRDERLRRVVESRYYGPTE